MTDRRKTFQGETPETSDVVLCDHCGGTLHAPEDGVFWKDTAGHTCEPQLKVEIEMLRRALALAEHDQIDLLQVCREYAAKTHPMHKELREIRDIRADRIKDRLEITRAALKDTKP